VALGAGSLLAPSAQVEVVKDPGFPCPNTADAARFEHGLAVVQVATLVGRVEFQHAIVQEIGYVQVAVGIDRYTGRIG